MRTNVSTRLMAVLAAAAAVLAVGGTFSSSSASPGTAQQPAAGHYLNLHQCVYYPKAATDHLTTVTPSKDGRFTTGTKVSATADTTASCGAGDGNYGLIPILSGVKALDLSAGRYLNLHQCVYYPKVATDHFTIVVPTSKDFGRFGTGTNVSNTVDTTASCTPGDGNYTLVPILSGVKTLDLTAGRYLNLHQCMYYPKVATDHFSIAVPTSKDFGRFGTGTKISNTADTTPSCTPGDGNYTPVPILSGVQALALA